MTTADPQTIPPDDGVPPVRMHQAFELVQPLMAALAPDALVALNLEVTGAFATTMGCIPKLAAFREEIVTKVNGFDIRYFDNLENYAYALMEAQMRFVRTAKPLEPFEQMNEELIGRRDQLLADVVALEKHRVLDGRQSELRGVNGYKNVTFDVLLLSSILRANWAAIAGKTMLQLADIEQAEKLAERMLKAVGIREQNQKKAAEGADVRQRAFTLFIRAYDEVRRALSFLRWHEKDVESILPSLYSGLGGSKAKPDVTDPVAPDNKQPGDGVVVVGGAHPGIEWRRREWWFEWCPAARARDAGERSIRPRLIATSRRRPLSQLICPSHHRSGRSGDGHSGRWIVVEAVDLVSKRLRPFIQYREGALCLVLRARLTRHL